MSDSDINQAQSLARAGDTGRLASVAETDAALDLLASNGEATAHHEGPAVPRRTFSPRMLWRYKWTVLGVSVLLAGATLPLIWTLITPEYVSTATLQVRSHVPRFISHTEETGQIPTRQYEQYLLSQVAIMQNPTVLQRVLERPDVQRTAWYTQPASPRERWLESPSQPLPRLMETLSIEPIRKTELISIAMRSRHPHDAQVIANAVLDEYLKFAREQFSEEDRQLLDELETEEQKLRADISFSERVVAEARRELLTGSPDELLAQRWARVDELQADVDDLDFGIKTRERQLGALTPPNTAAHPDEADETATGIAYARDPEWLRLQSAQRNAQQQLELDRMRFGPKSDRMMRSEKAAAAAQLALEQRERHLDQLASVPVPVAAGQTGQETLATNPQALQSEIDNLQFLKQLKHARADELRDSFEREFNRSESLRTHSEELQRNKEKLHSVLNRREEVLEKGRVPASIRTIGRAMLPTEPKHDKRLKLSAAALIGALGAGLACAYVQMVSNPQVQELEDVQRSVQGAFLGRLPLQRDLDASALESSPLQAECVRIVRTALLNRLDGPGGHVVQVASAGPGSGKSTLSILLARSVAQSGKRVLLVDADVRRPSLAKHFSIGASPGLLDLLANREAESKGIRATTISGLSVMAAGGLEHREDVELLANGALSSLLARWRNEYDIVLLDGAPLLGTADAAILARQVDGTILVVRERHCRRASLMEALALLGAAGGRLLGTVFVGSTGGGSYGYGYGYGYGYEDHPERLQRDDASLSDES